ncbi:MAG TPA: hypothetical protein VHR88_03080 [Solirubrobacteraceae bacterium]|jgi:hypothetical protein|nr:hypothetical protein [Solirubrobacteraceae bacterium]
MRWPDGRHDDPGIDADLAELGKWGPELRVLRQDPRPAFLVELDHRMQPEFSRGRADEERAAQRARPRRRWLPALAIAAPAAAAAVAVIVVLVAGGGNRTGPGKLPVAVQSAPAASASGGALAPAGSNALSRPGGPSAPATTLVAKEVSAGQPFMVRYSAPRARIVFVSLSPVRGGSATTTRRVDLPPGTGTLRIATDALDGGDYALVISLPSGQSALRDAVRILD